MILMLLMIAGCAHQQYLERFPRLGRQETITQERDGVFVSVHQLIGSESRSYFEVDLPSKGYIPLHLVIDNQTASSLVIRPSYLDLVLASSHEVAKVLHYDTSSYMYCLGAPAFLFFWPAIYWVGKSGYQMYQANKEINAQVDRMSYEWQNPEIIIYPYEKFERFMFVRSYEYKSNFTLKLFDQDQKKLLSFDFDMMQISQ